MTLLLADLARASRDVADTASRSEKVDRLASLLERSTPAQMRIAVHYLSGELPQGRIGVGPAALREAYPTSSAEHPSLDVATVDGTLQGISGIEGSGAVAARVERLRALLQEATGEEQRFLSRLLRGELRQGASEGVMVSAVARASGVRVADVRRALMLTGRLAEVAAAARAGPDALGALGLRLFRPVQPMLASSADDPEDVLERIESPIWEWKLDGARIQVHRSGQEVRVFSRQLNDVTVAVPEVVEAARSLPVDEVVLDGETLALRPDRTPYPFQTTMRRFGRSKDVEALRGRLPLSVFFFDALHVDGDPLIDRSLSDRLAALDRIADPDLRVPRRVLSDAGRARAFLDDVRARGHEGVVAKAPDATYEAGRRGSDWIKVKPAHTLDLVVLAAEWGHGRRKGWLSNLHLGARDPAGGGFVMLGKTFKGLTDAMLKWQTRVLQEMEIGRNRYTVFVEPALVVEIAFNEIQASSRYPGGLALRFARVKAFRPDKDAEHADTIDAVRALFAASGGHDLGPDVDFDSDEDG